MKLRATLLFSVALIIMATMGSCTKNYTCRCIISYSGYPGLPDSTIKEYSITDTKSGAKSKCEGESIDVTKNYIHTIEHCYLY